jgi:hypothetical protein
MATSQSLDLKKLIPPAIRNELLDGLISNTFNRFVSEENSVLVNGRIGTSVVGDTDIVPPSFDRQVNALVPALYSKSGTEVSINTFEDFINKMVSLDVDIAHMREWMAEEYFNYSLPINIDKFINYVNYLWVKPLTTGPEWNMTNDPEFYVIARPSPTDIIKNPVRLATTSSIQLWANGRPTETFTVTFTSNSHFTITSDFGNVTANVTALTSNSSGDTTQVIVYDNLGGQLMSFVITVGTLPFGSGDSFTVKITYFTSNILINFSSISTVGKGAISSVQTLSPLMTIDGSVIAVGDRILVKDQTDKSKNGIYIVTLDSEWKRTTDTDTAAKFGVGSVVYVNTGTANGGKTYESAGTFATSSFDFAQTAQPIGLSTLNDWQTGNYWVHRDDITSIPNYAAYTMVSATRPIIEYNNSVELNSYVDSSGTPGHSSTVINARQFKYKLNQIPQFNLYRYDGTHQGATSGIFFYVEDPDYTTDAVLKRRVKTTADADFIFGCGLADIDGRLLYYKSSGILKSVWQGSVTTAIATTPVFAGNPNKGTMTITSVAQYADNQKWEAIAISPTQFSIKGIRSGVVYTATVGTPFTVEDFSGLITAGINPFENAEQFSFNIIAPLSPRYVKKLSDGSLVNYPGGYTADALDGVIDGAWMTPARMFENLDRQTVLEITFGDFLNHARNVVKHQDGFTGSSFGINNVRNLNFDETLGGTIREFSSNFPLLASSLIQPEMSTISILEFVQQQYMVALASIDRFISEALPSYIAGSGSILTSMVNPDAPDIQRLLAHFESIRAEDVTLKTVFGDTTAKVTYWPATLPILGLLPKVTPSISFDFELGIDVMVHHDGHVSPVTSSNVELDRLLVQTVVPRSDGTSSAGIFSEAVPLTPYAGQLWVKPSTFAISIFDVVSDTDTVPTGYAGAFWYKKSANELYEWNPVNLSWQPASLGLIPSLWKPFNSSAIRNSLVLAVENKLYDSVHAKQDVHVTLSDVALSSYSEVELARYAAKYGYDTYAPDYVASDAFTWNYSQAVLPFTTAARWFDVLTDYFTSNGLPGTCRPNLEPWKLMGFTTKPANWDAQYLSTITGNVATLAVAYAADVNIIPPFIGLPTVDGITLSEGDSLLLTGQFDARQNGIWLVSSGGWSRAANPLSAGLTINVLSGSFATTNWTVLTTGTIQPSVTPVSFGQIRTWLKSMWQAIKAANPALKLSVNINTDALLPPYVSAAAFESAEALTTVMPTGISLSYTFGQHGPIETIWMKSLEYGYGLARSYFRSSPLQFLDKTWGETYFKTNNNVRVERNLMSPLPPAFFLLHGEKLNIINTYTAAEIAKHVIVGSTPITWTGAGTISFVVTHTADNVTWFSAYANGTFIDYVAEGQTFSISSGGIVLTDVKIDDLGIPFDMGDTITLKFFDNIPDPAYIPPAVEVLPLGCEDCIANGAIIASQNATVPMVQVPFTYAFTSSNMKIFKGLGQWFTNLLRFNSVDTSLSPAAVAYRGWSIKLAHQLGVLIRPETLSIDTSLGALPSTAYDVVLKKSSNTSSLWISGLRIQLVQLGTKKLNIDGVYIPTADASDWIFRVEAYNQQHPVLERYILDTASEFETFYALQKEHTDLAWKHCLNHSSIVSSTVPLSITGLQNVVDFIYGYTDRLADLGWKISSDSPVTDAKTGRNLNWQLEIEKFIDHVYEGMAAGEGYILNPFMSRLELDTPVGLMAKYSDANFIDEYSTQAAYDVTGTAIPIDNIFVVRTDERSITYSQTPIFSAHVFTDEYEHVILMNQHFSDETNSTVIFDTFLGLRLSTAFLSYIRQAETSRKPTFSGFYLSGSDVKRNISSSIDTIGNYYDADQTFYDPLTAKHALSLLGFVKKDYFAGVNANDITQFNFWRGLIQAKGTNMAINAFVNYKKFIDASTDEFWAYKLATFGDARERTFPEIKINPKDATQKFSRFQFYSVDDIHDPLPLYTQIENSDDTYWFSIDDLGTGMKFEATPISEVITAPAAGYYKLTNIYHNGDAMSPSITTTAAATFRVVNASMIWVSGPGQFTVSGYTWNNPTKHSPIKLFDYIENTLVDEIGLWHPAIGIHAYAPLEVVNMISGEDPANYNYTTKTTDNVQYKHLKPWGAREVGQVFWDTSNLAYIPYYDATIFPSRDVRHARWGSLAEWASIDLYEWTESPVHPSAYNAQAVAQEGDSSIDDSVKLSGKVALSKFYSRDRKITAVPIAWSYVPTGAVNGHPSFITNTNTNIWRSGNILIADTGRVADADLIAGRGFSGWDIVNSKPVGELSIGTVTSYVIGSSTDPLAPVLNADLSLSIITGGVFGTRIGAVALTSHDSFIRMTDSTGFFQDVEVTTPLGVDTQATYKFDLFGLALTISFPTNSSITDIIGIFGALPAKDVVIREAIDFTTVVDFPSDPGTLFSNSGDYLSVPSDYGWRTWVIPTQAQLTSDLLSPYNAWLPVMGDPVVVAPSPVVIAAMKDSTSTLTLKSGITISRYSSTWNNWVDLSNEKLDAISNGTTNVSFMLSDTIDPNRLSIYSNGIQVNPDGYVITGKVVELVNTPLPEGTIVTLLYRAYQPTAKELAFDPSVADDVTIQVQYKSDYQYTQLEVRDEQGNITGTKYYFWVQDKTIPQANKSMSLSQAAALLKSGAPRYAVFSRLQPGAVLPSAAYDSFAISGLNTLITKNDSYKLRMLRDFTLRDDPEELNLKNIHTEWALIRKGQSSKIPAALWEILTNAVAGTDTAGNQLPSKARIDYDARNNTRTRYGFNPGQIFAETSLVRASVTNTILNTNLVLNLAGKKIPDYISALNFDDSENWFKDAATARATMSLIWNTARPAQINEIFFDTLDDALSNNYEFSDMFKTSFITVNSTSVVDGTVQVEQADELY